MGMVLQLSHTDDDDPEGWTAKERGVRQLGRRGGRKWGLALEAPAFVGRLARVPSAAARCYLHLDGQDRMWLSAEDGCEGVLATSPQRRRPFFGLF